MSMIARFVQIKPSELKALLDDPESIESVFEDDGAGGISPAATAGAMENLCKLFAARGPGLLSGALPGMDPKMRETMMERLGQLGLTKEVLESGKGGEALANIMMSRMGGMKPPAAAGGAPRSAKSKGISLDKGWHGVHYLLCGASVPDATILGQVVMGGTEIGEDFSGYGEARYFTPAEVAATARELGRANLEAEIKARFDPALMNGAKIYPGGWDVTGSDWLFEEFRKLRDFYAGASAQGNAVVTCIL
ncbi:MAG TPA: YfbM family protein [Candidatus Binataceae bacterium]|nr:YfbM family protein [Candidatus Binataceae bacterium]